MMVYLELCAFLFLRKMLSKLSEPKAIVVSKKCNNLLQHLYSKTMHGIVIAYEMMLLFYFGKKLTLILGYL